MSSAALPSRGQCIQVIDNYCQCPWFAPSLLDQNICGRCGHGIHAHVDYVSVVVSYHPANQCTAYVQKTPLAQRCTCKAQPCDHVATNNPYQSEEPWTVLDYLTDSNGPSYDAAISYSNDTISDSYTPSSMSFYPADADEGVTFFHDSNPVPITTAPTFSHGPYRASSPSTDAGDIPLPPTSISSPSSNNTSSGIQSGVTQIQVCNSYDYFVPYPDHFIDSSYARQPDGTATNENLYYRGDS